MELEDLAKLIENQNSTIAGLKDELAEFRSRSESNNEENNWANDPDLMAKLAAYGEQDGGQQNTFDPEKFKASIMQELEGKINSSGLEFGNAAYGLARERARIDNEKKGLMERFNQATSNLPPKERKRVLEETEKLLDSRTENTLDKDPFKGIDASELFMQASYRATGDMTKAAEIVGRASVLLPREFGTAAEGAPTSYHDPEEKQIMSRFGVKEDDFDKAGKFLEAGGGTVDLFQEGNNNE